VEQVETFFTKFGGRMPKALLEEAGRIKAKLRRA
jgi:hypothetical protein